jgi:hypothetical protein
MVRFHVDDNRDGATYDVYKRFVCYHSPVFTKAFSGQNREVRLQDTSPCAFEIFIRWLYTQDIFSGRTSWPSCDELIALWLIGRLRTNTLATKSSATSFRKLPKTWKRALGSPIRSHLSKNTTTEPLTTIHCGFVGVGEYY